MIFNINYKWNISFLFFLFLFFLYTFYFSSIFFYEIIIYICIILFFLVHYANLMFVDLIYILQQITLYWHGKKLFETIWMFIFILILFESLLLGFFVLILGIWGVFKLVKLSSKKLDTWIKKLMQFVGKST